jgi:hypothetical protein
MRDPRKDPKVGDVFAGPIMRLRVDYATVGIGGLVSVVCSFSFNEPDKFSGARTFTTSQFEAFVGGEKTEVLHAAE